MLRAYATIGLACLAGCRPSPPVPLEPVAKPVQERTPAPVLEQLPEPAPVVRAPTVPPAQQRASAETPYPRPTVVVQPVTPMSPVVLFSEERAAIRRRAARRLVTLGYDVVPVAELERIEAAAKHRELVLEGDETCRAPLSIEDVSARYFSQHRTASIGAACFDGCELTISVEDPRDPDSLETYASEVEHGWDPGEWKRAAARASETNTSTWGGVGGMVSSSHPPAIMFTAPEHIGPWEHAPDPAPIYGLELTTQSCGHPDPNVSLTWAIALEVGAAGKVKRCEVETEHSRARDSDGACLCEAANALEFPRGKPGRRLRVDGIDSGARSRTVIRGVQLGTEPWVRRLEESSAMARCEPELTRTEPFEVNAVLSLATEGSVTNVELFGPIDDAPTMRWARCLVQEWSSFELPCAPPGIDQLHVTVDVRR